MADRCSCPEAIWQSLPAPARAEILARGIRLTVLDTAALAARHAPRPELLVRMQGVALVGVFLRLAPFAQRLGFSDAALFDALGDVLRRYFGKRGSSVVDANLEVIREAYASLIDITSASGATHATATSAPQEVPA